MGKLSIEEKANAYDKAVKEASIAYKDEDKHLKATLERIFPELKESEDELSWLTRYIEEEVYNLSMDIRDYEDHIKLKKLRKSLVWLENQGQKETTWNKEDEENMNNVLYIFNQLKDPSFYEGDNIAEKTINWIKSLKDRLCSNNEYNNDMLGAIAYCIKNNRPLEKEHIAWFKKQCEKPTIYSEDTKIKKIISDILLIDNDEIREILDANNVLIRDIFAWLEKQGEKPQGKSAREAINEEKVDNQNCYK